MNRTLTLTRQVVTVLAVAAMVGPARADERLFAKQGCTACHSIERQVVGPSLNDVARKYKARDDAVTYLALKLQQGSVGVWGQIPMPANPGISADDARVLAAWILAR